MPSTDITYCARECGNMECERNLKNVTIYVGYMSMCSFDDCKEWRKKDEVR